MLMVSESDTGGRNENKTRTWSNIGNTGYRTDISIHTLLAESDSNFDQILILILSNILQNTLYLTKNSS